MRAVIDPSTAGEGAKAPEAVETEGLLQGARRRAGRRREDDQEGLVSAPSSRIYAL